MLPRGLGPVSSWTEVGVEYQLGDCQDLRCQYPDLTELLPRAQSANASAPRDHLGKAGQPTGCGGRAKPVEPGQGLT